MEADAITVRGRELYKIELEAAQIDKIVRSELRNRLMDAEEAFNDARNKNPQGWYSWNIKVEKKKLKKEIKALKRIVKLFG